MENATDPPVGCMIAQRLTASLTGLGLDYATLSGIIYGELRTLASELAPGDWVELPDGTALALAHQPRPKA